MDTKQIVGITLALLGLGALLTMLGRKIAAS